MKNNVKVILVIIGTIIGAGFASGKEIYNFFAKYGDYGLTATIVSGILIGLIIYIVSIIILNYKVKSNREFINLIHGSNVFYNIINLFLLIIFYVMIAGFSGYFKQEFNICTYITSSILSSILFVILINKIDGIIKTNEILIPILILITIYIIIKYSYFNNNVNIIKNNLNKSLIDAILYASYNSIILIPIIISLKKYICNLKDAISISVTSTILIIALSYGICFILIRSNNAVDTIDLPILKIIDNRLEKILYSIVIQMAIITSAISVGFALLNDLNNFISDNSKTYKVIVFIMCLLGIPISAIGFGNIINVIYPIFGVLGIIQFILIFKIILKKK